MYDVCCFAPLSVFASLIFVLAPVRRAFQRKGTRRAELLTLRIALLAVWGIAWFVFPFFIQLYDAAYDAYAYSTDEYSQLSSATVAQIKSNRDAILLEYGMRTLLWDGYTGQSCFTQEDVCRLADEMYRNTGIRIWRGGSTAWMLISGLIPAIAAVVSAVGLPRIAAQREENAL